MYPLRNHIGYRRRERLFDQDKISQNLLRNNIAFDYEMIKALIDGRKMNMNQCLTHIENVLSRQ